MSRTPETTRRDLFKMGLLAGDGYLVAKGGLSPGPTSKPN